MLGLALVLALGSRAAAQFQPGEEQLTNRVALVGAYLDEMEEPARRHYATWITLLSATAIAQFTLASVADTDRERVNYAVGATLSVAGIGSMLFTPHQARKAYDAYRKLPESTERERRDKLSRGEAWIAAEAAEARFIRSWIPQVGATIVGLGAGFGLGFAFEDNWAAGLRVGLGALAITQVRVWSHPTQSLKAERRYLNAPTPPVFALAPWTQPKLVGLSLRGRF